MDVVGAAGWLADRARTERSKGGIWKVSGLSSHRLLRGPPGRVNEEAEAAAIGQGS